MARRWTAVRVALLAVLVCVLPAGAGAEAAATEAAANLREAHVTYLTTATVYVDAGSEQGLKEGDVLDVVRDGQVVARLRVFVLSPHKVGCRREDGGVEIRVGDLVAYRSASAVAAPAVAVAPRTAADRYGRLRSLGLSGRVGVNYIYVRQPDSDYEYHRPGLDLRLDGRNLAGSGVGVDVDVRSYRTYRSVGSGSSDNGSDTRVYRANASWVPNELPLRLALGRQYSPALATVSLFDGSLIEYFSEHVGAGVLAGTQPDPVHYGFSTDVQEYGAYGELHSKVGADRRWATTLGLIGSYDRSHVNREFLYLQGRYDDRITSLYVAEEIDVNRGWKRDQGESAIASTSTFAFARVQAEEHVAFSGGVDNRRNVRLYRDYVSPETEFDDRYRSGYWVGTDLRFGWFRAGADTRFSRGGSGGSADAYSLGLGAARVTQLHLDLRTRSTRYSSDSADGWLHSFTIGMPIGDRVEVSANGGLRDETSRLPNGPDARLVWYGIDGDVLLGRNWFYLLSLVQNQGDNQDNLQVYTALSYRF